MVVSNEMDEFAKYETRQKDRPEGVVFQSDDSSITVWAKTWSEILNDARARLTFFSQQLNYQADSDSELEYLKRVHSKYIPGDLAQVATGGSGADGEEGVPDD